MKKYRWYLLVLLIAFCMQGCSKQQDVEDHSFVLAMGFERLNEKKVLVRYSYADFDKAQSDSGTKIPSRSLVIIQILMYRLISSMTERNPAVLHVLT